MYKPTRTSRRRVGRFATALLAGGVLAAAMGATTASAAEQIELTQLVYSSHGQSWKDFLHAKAAAFEALHPNIHLNFIDSGGSEAAKLNVMLAAGTPPDVADFYPGMAAPFVGKDVFMDLRPFVKRDNIDLAQLMPPTVEAYTINGELWGIPVSLYPVVAWYNEDLFSAAGLATPYELGLDRWTWDTVADYAKKLTVRDANGNVSQWGLDRFSARPEIKIKQAGGQPFDSLTNPTESRWNTPAVVDALSWMKKIFIDDRSASVNWQPDFYFWTGRSGIDLVDGPGIVGVYMSKVDFKWDIVPQPKGPASRGTVVTAGLGLQVLQGSAHPDAAWEWVKFISLRPEAVTDFVKVTGGMPTYTSITREYRRYVPVAPDHWTVFSDVALNPDSFPGYLIPDTRVTATYNKYLSQIWSGQIPPQTAVEKIDQEVNALLADDAKQ